METDPSLQQKFHALQEETQRRAKLRLQKKEKEKHNSAQENGGVKNLNGHDISNTFGVPDDMKLAELYPVPNEKAYISEEFVQHLNDQIRESKDENGRIYKLLSERDFEIKMLKKKLEEEKAKGGLQVTNETAATKIVELSKKVRELTAEMESEKTKCRQWQKKHQDLQLQMQVSALSADTRSVTGSTASLKSLHEDKLDFDAIDVKELQEKLRQAESKLAEYRNQTMTLKQEMKVANKVLAQEVGEGVSFQSLLSANSSWRGRAQTILTLQSKLEETRSQLEALQGKHHSEDDISAKMSVQRKTQDERYRDELRRIEKDRKEALEKSSTEYKILQGEHETLKQKMESTKARNKVLSGEVKSLKQQMQTLLAKGHHDDELIEALMKQQTQLRQMLDSATSSQNQNQKQQQDRLKEISQKQQHDTNIVENLKIIIAEKEAKVKGLEDEVRQIKFNHQMKAQIDSEIQSRSNSSLTSLSKPCTPTLAAQGNDPPIGKHQTPAHPPRINVLGINSRPSSSSGVDRSAMVELQYECQEYRTLMQAAEVEKDRLSELVRVQEERMKEAMQRYSDIQSELLLQKRKCVQLEKQLGKVTLTETAASSGGRKKSSTKSGNLSNREPPPVMPEDEEDDETDKYKEILSSFAVQKDENEALKAALQSTLQAKEDDLKVYRQTIEETKRVFLQALRQLKQTTQSSA